MLIDFSLLKPDQIYHCMTQTLIPRPIAWVLSENLAGDFNLAPFSYFTAVSSDPPMILLSLGRKPDGAFKDTRVNIEARRVFVIHIAHRELAGILTETSRTLPLGESELTRAGLATVPFGDFRLPRLADCRVAMACELDQVIEVGSVPQTLLLGQVKQLYVDDQVVQRDAKGRLLFDAAAIDPLGRLGGGEYVTFGDVLRIPRPA